MRLRQIALVARDLEPVENKICAVFGTSISFRDPGVGKYGLINCLIPFGNTFLEVVCPSQEGTTAGRLLDRRGGDGGYMVLNQVDSLDGFEEKMEAVNVRIVESLNLPDAQGRHLHPRDIGAAIVSIDTMTPPESWKWGGPDWQSHVHTKVAGEIVGVDLQSSDPAALAQRWAEVLDCPLDTSGAHPTVQMDAGFVRCIPDTDGRGDGVSGLHIKINDRAKLEANAAAQNVSITDDTLELCGTTFHLAS
ncbi:MAG: VOC family protein [Candidatus Hydrogenedentota bacterium]